MRHMSNLFKIVNNIRYGYKASKNKCQKMRLVCGVGGGDAFSTLSDCEELCQTQVTLKHTYH